MPSLGLSLVSGLEGKPRGVPERSMVLGEFSNNTTKGPFDVDLLPELPRVKSSVAGVTLRMSKVHSGKEVKRVIDPLHESGGS